MKRIKANDPVALSQMGTNRYNEGDHEGAFEYYTKAAELGDMDGHYNVSLMYHEGEGARKDLKKEIYHLEEAAIGGQPWARFNLGCEEGNSGNHERAMKHFIIAANLGDDKSLEEVKKGFQRGVASKEDYAAVLRGHQAAVDATKSEQREKASAFYKL
jgi:TPR repeat protein